MSPSPAPSRVLLPLLRSAPARSFVAVALLVGAAALSGCGVLGQSGACVRGGSTLYFCQDDSLSQCQEFWCDGDWSTCSYFEDLSCDEIGFADSVSLDSFTPASTPAWTYGGGSGGGGGGDSGSGSGSLNGACAYYDPSLNRILCDTRFTATSCSGKFMGVGTTCSGLSCTSTTNPSSCTVPGAGGGSTPGGTCDNTWTCQYDGQATPMCSWACTQSGTQRTQTCQVLASMMTSGNAGECCTVCR